MLCYCRCSTGFGWVVVRNAYRTHHLLVAKQSQAEQVPVTPAGPTIRSSSGTPVPILHLPAEADRAKIMAASSGAALPSATVTSGRTASITHNNNRGSPVHGQQQQQSQPSSLFPPLAWRASRSHSGASSITLANLATSPNNGSNGSPHTSVVTELVDERRIFSSPSNATNGNSSVIGAGTSSTPTAAGTATLFSPSHSTNSNTSNNGVTTSPQPPPSSLIVSPPLARDVSLSVANVTNPLDISPVPQRPSSTTGIANGSVHVPTFAERASKRSTAPAMLGNSGHSHSGISSTQPSLIASGGSGANATSLNTMIVGGNGSAALPPRPSPSPAHQRRTLPRAALRAPRTPTTPTETNSINNIASNTGGGGAGGTSTTTTTTTTPASIYGSVPSTVAATALSSSLPFHLPTDLLAVDGREPSVEGTPTPSPSRHHQRPGLFQQGIAANNHHHQSGSLLVTPLQIYGGVGQHGHKDDTWSNNGNESSLGSRPPLTTNGSTHRKANGGSGELYRLPGEYEEALPAPPPVPVADDETSNNPLMDDIREPRSYNPVRNPLIPDNRQAHARDSATPTLPLRSPNGGRGSKSIVTALGTPAAIAESAPTKEMTTTTTGKDGSKSPRLTRFADGTVPGSEHHTVTMTSLPGISAKDAVKEGKVVEKVVRLGFYTSIGALATCGTLMYLLFVASELPASNLLYGFMAVRIIASIWLWVIISVFWPKPSIGQPQAGGANDAASKLFHSVNKSRSHGSAFSAGAAGGIGAGMVAGHRPRGF
jgi:hypothetical protein